MDCVTLDMYETEVTSLSGLVILQNELEVDQNDDERGVYNLEKILSNHIFNMYTGWITHSELRI